MIQKDNIIQVFIKDSILNIDINKDFRWSSEIKINKRVFYFLYIVFNKKNKLIQIYINHEEIAESKTILNCFASALSVRSQKLLIQVQSKQHVLVESLSPHPCPLLKGEGVCIPPHTCYLFK